MHTGTGKKLADLRQVPWPYDSDSIRIELWMKRAPRRITVWRVYADHEDILGEIQNGKWLNKEEL